MEKLKIYHWKKKIWTDEKMDFSCIEIKKEDNIQTFFSLDNKVLYNNSYPISLYKDQKVITYAINKNDLEVGLSNGEIKDKESYCFFTYTCNTYPGSSGGCIVNQFTNNVIGIHRGEKKNEMVNYGIYISNIIKFIKESKETKFNKVK